LLYAFGTGGGLVQASPSGHAPQGTVIIDGVTVPDVGPLPTVVPIPASNLNSTAKVELGKQLYFDGRLSKK
jgi:cytochrome c peroxidase